MICFLFCFFLRLLAYLRLVAVVVVDDVLFFLLLPLFWYVVLLLFCVMLQSYFKHCVDTTYHLSMNVVIKVYDASSFSQLFSNHFSYCKAWDSMSQVVTQIRTRGLP